MTRACVAAATTALLLFALSARRATSQPAGSRVIEGVTIEEQAAGALVTIRFTFPLRYVKHFPLTSGDLLQVFFQPVVVSRVDRRSLRRRESALLSRKDRKELLDVTYEGPSVGGPMVTLRFREPFSFTVNQGADYRSLTVSLVAAHQPDATPAGSSGATGGPES